MPRLGRSLDLRSQIPFPTFTSLPKDSAIDLRYFGEDHSGAYRPVKHWCLLAEIVELVPYLRPMFSAKDKAGVQFMVTMYLDNNVALPNFWHKYCKPGNVVAIMYAKSHLFMDGQTGIRVEEVGTIKIFPCSLDTLLNISDGLNSPSKDCQFCKKDAGNKCARCSMLYCDRDCQKRDWEEHRNKCLAFKQVVEWRGRNWRQFDQYML